MKSYRVLEQHLGDKQYWKGDTRQLEESDAAELLTMGLLEEINPADEEAAAKEAAKQAKKEAKAAEQAAKAAEQAAKEAAEQAAKAAEQAAKEAAEQAAKAAEQAAKAVEQAAKEAAEKQQQPENGGTANGEKALTGDLLDKAQGGAPQNKAQ